MRLVWIEQFSGIVSVNSDDRPRRRFAPRYVIIACCVIATFSRQIESFCRRHAVVRGRRMSSIRHWRIGEVGSVGIHGCSRNLRNLGGRSWGGARHKIEVWIWTSAAFRSFLVCWGWNPVFRFSDQTVWIPEIYLIVVDVAPRNKLFLSISRIVHLVLPQIKCQLFK